MNKIEKNYINEAYKAPSISKEYVNSIINAYKQSNIIVILIEDD